MAKGSLQVLTVFLTTLNLLYWLGEKYLTLLYFLQKEKIELVTRTGLEKYFIRGLENNSLYVTFSL
jgi:hypothetical protein